MVEGFVISSTSNRQLTRSETPLGQVLKEARAFRLIMYTWRPLESGFGRKTGSDSQRSNGALRRWTGIGPKPKGEGFGLRSLELLEHRK